MRVLRVAQKLYPEVTGGGPYHVHAMSRDQAAMGHDVTVLTTRDDESRPVRQETDGYTVIRVPKGVTIAGNDVSHGVARYLSQHVDEYDVVHAHSQLYFSTNVAALVRRFGDVPLAITNHGLYSQSAPQWVFDVYLRTLGRWTFEQADVVFCYTETDERRVRDLGVSSPIEVVSNGIDTDRFTPDGPAGDRLASPAVLFVGRLVEGKRPVDAVRAVAGLRERGVNARLYVAGTGPLEAEMRRVAADHGETDALTFLGHVPYDDMPDVYRAADVLLLPSRDEGLPRTILEALASTTPVVASDLEQIGGLLADGGATVPVGDIEAFAGALEWVLTSRERRERLGRNGRERVVSEWTWESTVEQTTEALSTLAADGTAGTAASITERTS